MTKELKNFIAGEWRASGHTFEKRSPFDGTLVAMVHEANEDMVNDAVIAGHDISIGSQSSFGARCQSKNAWLLFTTLPTSFWRV